MVFTYLDLSSHIAGNKDLPRFKGGDAGPLLNRRIVTSVRRAWEKGDTS